jgi:hypothetical protein
MLILPSFSLSLFLWRNEIWIQYYLLTNIRCHKFRILTLSDFDIGCVEWIGVLEPGKQKSCNGRFCTKTHIPKNSSLRAYFLVQPNLRQIILFSCILQRYSRHIVYVASIYFYFIYVRWCHFSARRRTCNVRQKSIRNLMIYTRVHATIQSGKGNSPPWVRKIRHHHWKGVWKESFHVCFIERQGVVKSAEVTISQRTRP